MHSVVRHREGWKNNRPRGKNCVKIIRDGRTGGIFSVLEGSFLTIFRNVIEFMHLDLAQCTFHAVSNALIFHDYGSIQEG